MKVNREALLNDLALVKAGLSPREFIEQSSCFVFQDGMVMTFNDEVACRKSIDLNITGAVQAPALVAILEKLEEPELKVRENDNGELEFRGKNKGFAITKDAEVFLPIDRVEVPEKWRSIPAEFSEAVELVRQCVSKDETKFTLTCVHLHPEYIEACDNSQIMRCKIDTGLKRPILVRGSSLAHITSLGMDQIATTKSWIHFKNPTGLIFSCRKYIDEYYGTDELLKFKGHPIVIPKGMAKAADRAAIFAADKSGDPLVMISLSNGVMKIKGEGLSGNYWEAKKVNYQGPAMDFLIAPALLRHIAERYSDAALTSDKLKVSGGHWEYVTVLARSNEEEEEQESEPSEEEESEE